MKQFVLNDSQNNDIHVYLYEAESNPIGVLQIIHGASEHFARYGLFAQYLNSQGFIVVGHDILGHGLSTDNLNKVHFADKFGHKLAYESIVLVKDWVKENYHDLDHYVLGHSMGSFLARKLVLDYPNAYKKAVFSGSAMPAKPLLLMGKFLTSIISFFRGPQYVSKLIQNMSIDANQKKMRKDGIISGDNEEWLSRDKDIQEYYKHSPMCGQPFTVQANKDMFQWIIESNDDKKIKKGNHYQPILLISGSHDALSNYGKQIQSLAEKMISFGYTNVQVKIYPKSRHEVLNELNKNEVYEDVKNFLLM
ncbi:MAG: alpha/beta fold hydrolase [Candidatus Izemoplasmatales bacterium]